MTVDRDEMLAKLVDIQYERNDVELRARQVSRARRLRRGLARRTRSSRYRIEFWGDEVEQLSIINPTSGEVIDRRSELFIYPAKHFVMPEERIAAAVDAIQQELEERLEAVRDAGQAAGSAAAERADAVRHRDDAGGGLLPGHRELQPAAVRAGRRASRRTRCIDFFPEGLSCCSSTSRTSRCRRFAAMFAGDRSRKTTLVEHGFRLPSALDNRPLQVRRMAANESTR